MLPLACPTLPSDPMVDVVVQAGMAPSLQQAVDQPGVSVIWVDAGYVPSAQTVQVTRDVMICGPATRVDIEDLAVDTEVFHIERITLRPAARPALQVLLGEARVVGCDLVDSNLGGAVGLQVEPQAEVVATDLTAHDWLPAIIAKPIVNLGTLTLERGLFERNLNGVLRANGPSASTTIEDATFVDNSSPFRGGAVGQSGGSLHVTRTQFLGWHSASLGGAIFVQDTELSLVGSVVEYGDAYDSGGALYARAASVYLEGNDLNGIASRGGAVAVRGGTLTVPGGRFQGDAEIGGALWAGGPARVVITNGNLQGSARRGGGVAAEGSGLASSPWVTLVGGAIEASEAAQVGGGAAVFGGARLELDGTRVSDCSAAEGGGLYAEDAELWVHEVELDDNQATSVGGGASSVRSAVDAWRLVASGNVASDGAAWWSADDTAFSLDEAELCGHSSASGAVLSFVQPAGTVDLRFGALAGNDATALISREGGAGLLRLQNLTLVDAPIGLAVGEGPVEVVNTLFAGLPQGAVVGAGVSGGHNLTFDAPSDVSGFPGPGSVQGDPRLEQGSEGGACVSGLYPGPGSPAREAGDPELPGEDGRPLDIGRFQSDPSGDEDRDGDGVLVPDDCDDGDATVFPGAPERADDGVDQDCDGYDSRSWVAGGRCDTGTGGGWWLGLLAMAATTGRRARASRPWRLRRR